MTKAAVRFCVVLGLSLAASPIRAQVCTPDVTCPTDITVAPTGPSGAVVTYVATCASGCGVSSFSCTPPPGSTFPLGSTQTSCTCTASTGDVASCSFTVAVIVVNTPPTFSIGPPVTVAENLGPQTFTAWATDIDPSTPPGLAAEANQSVSMQVSNDNPSLFTAQPAVSPDGTLTFTSAADACGLATLTVVAKDDGGTALNGNDTSAPQQSTLTVVCSNNCPVADPLDLDVDQGATVNFQLPASDADGDALAYSISQAPAHGTVVLQLQTGAGSYTPVAGYCGPDSFEYRVDDGQCVSDEALVSIDVECIVEVAVDVKPGSDPNSFQCRKKGVLPVAILGSPTFDATSVDASTVTLRDGGAPVPARRRGRGNKNDVNGDGRLDLIVEFDALAVGTAIGCPRPANTLVPVTIEGETTDGTSFVGSDTLRIVP